MNPVSWILLQDILLPSRMIPDISPKASFNARGGIEAI